MSPHRLRISELYERALLDLIPTKRKAKVRARGQPRRGLDPRRSNSFDLLREASADDWVDGPLARQKELVFSIAN
jgi:hypothetical protein